MSNKLGKYRLMKGSPNLAPHLPETAALGINQFWRLLKKYGDIIVKPNYGSRGRNVIRIYSSGKDRYIIHYERRKSIVRGITSAYRSTLRIVGRGRYIVQRRVPLATVSRRPFDVRVIVQRKIGSNKWTVTGKVAKLAGKGYIVTNLTRSNGTPLHASNAIRRSTIPNRRKKGVLVKLNNIAVRTASCLRKMYPKHRTYGLDTGISNTGHIWIIEANRFPAMSHFYKLGDQTMIRRIKRFNQDNKDTFEFLSHSIGAFPSA